MTASPSTTLETCSMRLSYIYTRLYNNNLSSHLCNGFNEADEGRVAGDDDEGKATTLRASCP